MSHGFGARLYLQLCDCLALWEASHSNSKLGYAAVLRWAFVIPEVTQNAEQLCNTLFCPQTIHGGFFSLANRHIAQMGDSKFLILTALFIPLILVDRIRFSGSDTQYELMPFDVSTPRKIKRKKTGHNDRWRRSCYRCGGCCCWWWRWWEEEEGTTTKSFFFQIIGGELFVRTCHLPLAIY